MSLLLHIVPRIVTLALIDTFLCCFGRVPGYAIRGENITLILFIVSLSGVWTTSPFRYNTVYGKHYYDHKYFAWLAPMAFLPLTPFLFYLQAQEHGYWWIDKLRYKLDGHQIETALSEMTLLVQAFKAFALCIAFVIIYTDYDTHRNAPKVFVNSRRSSTSSAGSVALPSSNAAPMPYVPMPQSLPGSKVPPL
jgi:hypothetical protein